MNDEEFQNLNQKLEKIAEQLIEFGDGVLIMVSMHDTETGDTYMARAYKGNNHTLWGMTKDFQDDWSWANIAHRIKEER